MDFPDSDEAIQAVHCLEMPVEDIAYINGKRFALCGKVANGSIYRGTCVKIFTPDGNTKIDNITVNDLAVLGYITYAEKGDNIGLYFSYRHKTEDLKKMFPVEKGDIVLYSKKGGK